MHHSLLDLVCDMGDHLHSTTEILSPALFHDHRIVDPARGVVVLLAHDRVSVVITSYSIHYTKLYDKQLSEEERRQIEEWSQELVGLGELTLKVFEDVVLKNDKYMKLVTGDMYKVEAFNPMGSA